MLETLEIIPKFRLRNIKPTFDKPQAFINNLPRTEFIIPNEVGAFIVSDEINDVITHQRNIIIITNGIKEYVTITFEDSNVNSCYSSKISQKTRMQLMQLGFNIKSVDKLIVQQKSTNTYVVAIGQEIFNPNMLGRKLQPTYGIIELTIELNTPQIKYIVDKPHIYCNRVKKENQQLFRSYSINQAIDYTELIHPPTIYTHND